MAVARLPGWKDEGPLLQAFRPDGVSISVPVEELDHVPAPVDEHKERTGKGIGVQFGADDAAERIKGLAHVAGAAIEINMGRRRQAEHGKRVQSVSMTVRKVKGSRPLNNRQFSLIPVLCPIF